MLTELYIEALLADEALADEVWALWDAGVITDDMAAWAWWLMARPGRRVGHREQDAAALASGLAEPQ